MSAQPVANSAAATPAEPFRISPADSSSLIGLTSPAARYILALFMASNFLFTFATINEVKWWLPPVVAVLLVNAASVLLLLDRPDPFPLWMGLGVITAVTVSTLLVAFQLPDVAQVGRASWHLGANAWLLFFLALRHRAVMAWIGYLLMGAITIVWAVTTDRGVISGLLLLDTHAAILFVATLFAVFLRRTARRINEFDDRSIDDAAETAAAEAAADIRRQRVMELRAGAGPLLERLVNSSEPPSELERRDYRAAEALLRDGVRGRSLAIPRISLAATAARDRGVEVTLLDDRGERLPEQAAMERLIARVVSVLETAPEGTVTVRMHPKGRAVAVSIVSIGPSHSERIELDVDGNVVER